MLLAIDSSTYIASLALWQDGVVAEVTWHTKENHTAELLPNVQSMLDRSRTSLANVTGIVVAKGPGSFNGIRIGLSTAKGLALALNLPLVAISSLEVEAFALRHVERPVCPIHGAGREEVAAALFQTTGGQLQRVTEEHITTIELLCREVPADTVFCGELTPALVCELEERRGQAALVTGAGALRRAGYLAELGWRRISAGDFDDIRSLQALYLRRPPITVAKPKLVKPFYERENKDVAQKHPGA